MSDYGWIMVKDHLDNAPMQVMGPNDIPADLKGKLENGEGTTFKIYDDDGELYMSGRFLANDGDGADSADCLAPLDDYGFSWGATEIHYKKGNKWVQV